MSSELAEKMKAIREAEGLSQSKFAEVTGISLSTIKKYETGVKDPGSRTLLKVTTHSEYKKYTMWLMSGETNEAAGQISPALSPDGQNSTSNHQNGKMAG
ncbi:helix-turn-helix transcriptional regulator [Enterobacter cloacae]|uniref:helix-turn-helix domain-containing protein n=1 Tax=Enterobacter cloacae TaxID=550 RepID=UPI00317AEBF2